MVSCEVADVFTRLDCSRAEAFIGLKDYQFWVRLDVANCLALVQEEIVSDWVETELGFYCLA